MSSFFAKAKEIALDILFPPTCLVCRKSLESEEKEIALCRQCFDEIPVETALTCPICRARFAANIKICHRDASYRLMAASRYENEIVKSLIWRLKYEKLSAASKPLSEIAVRHLKLIGFNLATWRFLPMPLYPARERERGFNQTELIVKDLNRKTGLPILAGALVRVKDTKAQAELKDFEARKKNIENCFQTPHPELLKNQNIILADDVFTSGATMEEAVKTLKAGGAGRIIALTIAKAG